MERSRLCSQRQYNASRIIVCKKRSCGITLEYFESAFGALNENYNIHIFMDGKPYKIYMSVRSVCVLQRIVKRHDSKTWVPN